MKKLAVGIALVLIVSSVGAGSAYAKDDFEHGFRLELGAIAARSAVGLGVGVVNGVLGGGVAYNGLYVRPAPVYRPYYPPPVVYAPPPPPPAYYRVETRYYGPYYYQPPPPPPVVYRPYNYYGCH